MGRAVNSWLEQATSVFLAFWGILVCVLMSTSAPDFSAVPVSAPVSEDERMTSLELMISKTKGMYRKRIQKAWGHTAHRGWARLLLDRARDLMKSPLR